MEAPAPSTFSGGCACGAIRYECSAAPAAMVNCHCRDCQRAGGAGYSPTVVVPKSHLRILVGQPMLYERLGASGNTATRAFCGECGSPLFAWSSARPEMAGIRAGSLDDPSWFGAQTDVWTRSAQPWDVLAPHTRKFPRGRE